MACTCQNCGEPYKVDLLIPDQLWDRIRPDGKDAGAGLLCGPCIMRRVEDIDEYGALDARAAALNFS
jgi:hypothetical protein